MKNSDAERRAANAQAAHAAYLATVEHCESRPYRLYLELTSKCNLNCQMCPTNKSDYPVGKGFMSDETYYSVLEQFGRDAQRISFHIWGEPLLHPKLVPYVGHAREMGLYTKFSSNLVALDAALAGGLVDAGLDAMTVSLPAGRAQTFHDYTKADKFQQVLDNLALLLETRRSKGRTTPEVTWFFVVGSHNEKEIDTARTLADQIGVDHFVTHALRTMPAEEVRMTTAEKMQLYGDWVAADPQFDRYRSSSSAKEDALCAWPWERLVVDWDGSVLPCCLVFGTESRLTHLGTHGPKAVWNSEPLMAARRAGLDYRRGERHQRTICDTCYQTGFRDYL